MSKMTPWFPPHIKPARKGVYQICFTEEGRHERYDLMYATWTGLVWSSASYTKHDDWHKKFYGSEQKKYWRGFTKEQT